MRLQILLAASYCAIAMFPLEAAAQFFPSLYRDKLNLRAVDPSVESKRDGKTKPEDCVGLSEHPTPPPGAAIAPQKIPDTQELVGRLALGEVYNLIGHCVDPDEKPNLAERKIIPDLRQFFKEPGKYMGRKKGDADYTEQMPPVRKDDGTLATVDDWVAVDLVARTLYSEVASNPRCGDHYVGAIGKIIVNRMDAAARTAGEKKMYTKSLNIPGTHNVVPVLLASRQFAVWTGTDDANRWAACPAKENTQTYKFKDKKGQQMSSGQASNNNWIRAVETAIEMVMHGQEFRRRGKDFPWTYYTTSSEEHGRKTKQGYRHVANATIGGKSVNNVNCAEVWDAPRK